MVSRRAWVAVGVALAIVLVGLTPVPRAEAASGGGGLRRYVMLGDSYSSGEGLNNYYSESATATNGCHRSKGSWENQLMTRMVKTGKFASGEWLFAACSGDMAHNVIWGSPKEDSTPITSQLNQLTTDTRFVTMTIGGNDAGFDNVLKSCARVFIPDLWPLQLGSSAWVPGLSSTTGCNAAKDRASTVIGGTSLTQSSLGTRVLEVYRKVLQKAPYAKLTVLTYPTIFPTTYNGHTAGGEKYCQAGTPLGVPVGYRDSDVTAFRQYQSDANTQIALAVDKLIEQNLAGRISLVRLDQGEIATHTVSCGDSGRPTPYINGFLSAVKLEFTSSGSFHPNLAGHTAYAAAAYVKAATVSKPLSVVVTGPTTLTVGTPADITLKAKNGSPGWYPRPGALDANPVYTYGIRNVTPGIEIYGFGEVRQITATAPGTYAYTAVVSDGTGVQATQRITINACATTCTPTATAITAGAYHSCALITGGTAQCWGDNEYGQLGDGTNTNSSVPVTVSGLAGVTAITAGGAHSCALMTGGTARCWGGNVYGQLGNGTNTNSSVPVTVSGLAGVTAISAGLFHSCALMTGGTVRCWGYNVYGQLGNGTTTDSSVPVTVSGF